VISGVSSGITARNTHAANGDAEIRALDLMDLSRIKIEENPCT
jgi:hypothetical protein